MCHKAYCFICNTTIFTIIDLFRNKKRHSPPTILVGIFKGRYNLIRLITTVFYRSKLIICKFREPIINPFAFKTFCFKSLKGF